VVTSRVVLAFAVALGFALSTLVACGGGGPPLDAGCPVCQMPDVNVD